MDAAKIARGPYPAYIRDNPVMQGAFAGFMSWIWQQEWAHLAHTAETGNSRPSEPKSQLDAMIDEAVGLQAAYAESFAQWAIDQHWGVEGRDDQDDEPAHLQGETQ